MIRSLAPQMWYSKLRNSPSDIHLRNMLEVAHSGAVIVPLYDKDGRLESDEAPCERTGLVYICVFASDGALSWSRVGIASSHGSEG